MAIFAGKRKRIMPATYKDIKKDRLQRQGGMLYDEGGYYSPGSGIRSDIARWEGSSMKTNRPFEAEARDFNRVIPKGVRDRLTANQLDALYSYGYNVGMGNLKKRVLPTLEAYVDGRASADDVGRSMWATKDMMYRGLKRRREWERSMFAGRPYESRQNGIAYKPGRGNNAAVEVATMTPFQFTEPQPQIWQQEEGAEGVPEWFDVILERARRNPVVTGEPEVMTTPEPQEEKYTPSRADILLALTGMDSDNDQDEWSGLFRQYGNDDEQGQGLSIFGNGQRLFAGGGATDDPEDYESQVNAYMSNNTTGLPFVDENGVPMKEVVLNSVPVVYDRKLGRNLTDEEYMARHPKASTTFDRLDLPRYRAVTPAEGLAMKRSADRDWVENAISGVPREKGLEIVAPEADLLMLPRAVASGAIGATWNGSKELLKDATKGLSDYVAKHPKLQYGLAGLDAMMGTEGIERARNGKIDAQTAMDLAALAAPAYGVVKNGAKVAKETGKIASNVVNHPEWFRNAILDYTSPERIKATRLARKNGLYINDFGSLRQNVERLHKAYENGAKSTIFDYKDLTGIDIPIGKTKAVSWKKIPKNAGAFSDDENIVFPVTLDGKTNIAIPRIMAEQNGAHEQAHISNSFLNKKYGTPPLGVWDSSVEYFIPNLNHPIAQKYAPEFWKYGITNKHSIYPEETWANFMSQRSQNVPIETAFDNMDGVENLPKTVIRPFVNDYMRYLVNTYKPVK